VSDRQLFRVLSREEEGALRLSIERFGVIVPVVVDADGELVDGFHRRRLGAELGRPVPEVRLDVRGEEALDAARDLNLARRHLDKAERAPYTMQRKRSELAPSNRQIAEELGVSEATVRRDLALTATSDAVAKQPARGRDGKVRRHPRPKESPAKAEPRLVDVEPDLPEGIAVLCRDARDHYPGEEADLAFTSPPYNVGLAYDGDDSDDAMPHSDWLELLEVSIKVLVDGWRVARIVVNIPFGTGRRPYRALVGDVLEVLAGAETELEGIGVWDKGTTGERTSWGSWRSPTAPVMRDRAEALIVTRTPHEPVVDGLVDVNGRAYSPLLGPDRFPVLTQNVWQIPPARRGPQYGVEHPAPFPVELAENVIRLWGWPGCHVVDPFAGSGTTGVAALKLGCRATLIDQSERYCHLARQRLARR
jgi:DNA modification methylase